MPWTSAAHRHHARRTAPRIAVDQDSWQGYDEHCAACHDGGTMGPELWGESFIENRKGQDAAALFDRIKQTMPAESPGILADDQVLNVIAYILQQNGFPAGDKAIPDAKALAGVKFVSPSR